MNVGPGGVERGPGARQTPCGFGLALSDFLLAVTASRDENGHVSTSGADVGSVGGGTAHAVEAAGHFRIYVGAAGLFVPAFRITADAAELWMSSVTVETEMGALRWSERIGQAVRRIGPR
jgi:hypothetical protein